MQKIFRKSISVDAASILRDQEKKYKISFGNNSFPPTRVLAPALKRDSGFSDDSGTGSVNTFVDNGLVFNEGEKKCIL